MIFKMPMSVSSTVFLGFMSVCSGTSSLLLLFSKVTLLIEWESFAFLMDVH